MRLIPKPFFLVIMLWVTGLLAGAQFAKVSVLLPEISKIYIDHGDHIAWLLTLVSIVGAIFGGVAGALANRFGQKPILVASLSMAGLLSIWQSTYPSFGFMAGSRILEGVTHLGIVVTAPALMAQLSTDRWRGATMALWSTFFGVSFALFAWFGIPLVKDVGVRGLFLLHGAGFLSVAIATYALLPACDDAAVKTQPTKQPGPISLAQSYKNRAVVWPGLGWLFYTLTFLALLTILPSQMPDTLRPQMTTTMSLVGIGVSLTIVPLLLMQLRATTVVMTGFVCAAAVTAFGPAISLFTLSLLLFATLGLIQGGTFAAVAELNPSMSNRTLGYGFLAQTGNIGNLVGTPVMLVILGMSDQNTLLLVTCSIYGVGFLCLMTLAQRLR
ncbi:MAG: MFS transporter [Roseobacter sp.]